MDNLIGVAIVLGACAFFVFIIVAVNWLVIRRYKEDKKLGVHVVLMTLEQVGVLKKDSRWKHGGVTDDTEEDA